MKKGLGRGLDVLFEDNEQSLEAAPDGQPYEVSLSDIEPNRGQPRKMFDEEKLAELAASISQHGVISPLIVCEIEGGRYRIVAGERRWRAARIAGLKTVPVVVKNVSGREIMEISLIENLQREDLNIIEEALGYKKLSEEFGLTQEEMAKRVGKSRPVITNALRLLTLPEDVIALLESSRLSLAHGKSLLSCENKELISEIGNKAAEQELTVRELETLIKKSVQQPKKDKSDKPEKAEGGRLYFTSLESRIAENLGRKVMISGSEEKGKISLEYYSKEDLDILIGLLSPEE